MNDTTTMKKVLCISERGDKTFWSKAGVAFPNKDGSWNLYLDVLPISGKLQMRDYDEQELQARRERQPSSQGSQASTPF